jgi:hypothetical protein
MKTSEKYLKNNQMGKIPLNDQNLSDETQQANKRYYNDEKLVKAYIEGLIDGAKWYYIKTK